MDFVINKKFSENNNQSGYLDTFRLQSQSNNTYEKMKNEINPTSSAKRITIEN